MQANFRCRWLLVGFLVVSPLFLTVYARRGGGGSRGSYSRPSSSYSRPSPSYSRPSPSYSRPSPSYSRPAPAPAPKPAPAPAPRPAPAPAPRPAPSYSQTAPKPASPVFDRQPAYNTNFKESNPGIGEGGRQPAYNPNFNTIKLDGSGPAGPLPPYSPVGQPVPNAPIGPPPSYSQTAPKPANPVVVRQPPYNPNFKELNPGIMGEGRQPAYNPNFDNIKLDGRGPAGPPPPYSPVGHPVPYSPIGPPPPYQTLNQQKPQQSPPYRGPPTYPGISSIYSAQPGSQFYPKQLELNRPYVIHPGIPGIHKPNALRPYPVQPGYSGSHQPNTQKPHPVQPAYLGSHKPNTQKPYPVQPGYSGQNQPNTQKPYPVQPGISNSKPVANRPYPPQTLGGNVWQPNNGNPAPSYMNYGGIPTGTNMHIKPHKKKGFIGSLMTLGKNKSEKQNKYYGSYPSPYGIKTSTISHGRNSFLGEHGSSPAMYSIFPYMAAKKAHKIRKPKYGFLPVHASRSHYHDYYHRDHEGGIDPEYVSYFNVYDDKYVGKCHKPIQKKHSKVNCSGTFDELQCIANCDEGYTFPNNLKSLTNKCWHVTGIWKPMKNFPDCMPVCNNKCLNGGKCIAPEVCKCPAEYRGSICQFHFLNCNILKLIKDENLRWVCMHHKNETVCQVRCKATMDFDFTPPTEYRCTPDGVWKPDTLPQCDSD